MFTCKMQKDVKNVEAIFLVKRQRKIQHIHFVKYSMLKSIQFRSYQILITFPGSFYHSLWEPTASVI